MKVAYFSPFSPDKSGISDFSEELVQELAKLCEVDLFANKPITNEKIKENFQIYDVDDINDVELRNSYDHLIYQVGNNRTFHKDVVETFMKYPGILELHDLSLHHYLAEDTFVQKKYDKYIEIMKYCHGKEGEAAARRFLNGEIRAPWENQSNRFTVNKHLIDKAVAIIVHSDMARQFVKGIKPEAKVIHIPLHTTELFKDYNLHRKQCKRDLNLEGKIVLGSFGYATSAKRIEPIIKALAEIKKQNICSFKYCIVGQVEHVPVDELKIQYDLEEEIIVTGFTELETFKKYMGACDICFNLRYPTQGESSASLHRMLGMGKVILVTDIGTFQEYPENVVFKVSHGNQEVKEIVDCLQTALSDLTSLEERRKAAYHYALQNCSLSINAQKYVKFFGDIQKGCYQEEYIEHLLDVMQSIDLLDEAYITGHLKLW